MVPGNHKSHKWIRFKKVLVVWSLSGVTLNKRSVTIIHRLLESPHPWSRWVSHCDDHVGNLKQQQSHKKEVLPVLTWTGTGYPMKISYVKILLILNLVPDSLTIQVRSLKGLFSRPKKISKNICFFLYFSCFVKMCLCRKSALKRIGRSGEREREGNQCD